MSTHAIVMTVNGKAVSLEVAAHHTLLQALRDQWG
jgi:aerobic-type carbon monoxide dehydrogenase small subunit (CoxS/CutS family)